MLEQSLKKSWSSDSPRERSALIVGQNQSLAMENTMTNRDISAKYVEKASLILLIQRYIKAAHHWKSGSSMRSA